MILENKWTRLGLATVVLVEILAIQVQAQPLPTAVPRNRLEFLHLVAHWDQYSDPEYIGFLAEARPEIVQVGFYGAHFYSLSHSPHGHGYPAHFPVQGIQECGEWFQHLNEKIHGLNLKVVGHFNVKFLVGDPESDEGPRGFFRFYRDLWNEKELGPRPIADPRDLLEKNADGSLITNNSYSIGGMKEYWGCLNNPHWKSVLKAWAKQGIDRGVDGYMINYFYRHNCLCSHCQTAFRSHLSSSFTPEELEKRFEIRDLSAHRFTEIVSWHDPQQSTPLRREMLRFSQISNKRAFDEVFVEYGRSLKSDLIVGQWNHLGNFTQISGDERCLLPTELWGKSEDYTWYSTGDAAHFTDLAEGILGEGTLQARFLRGAFDDKPFTLGKYESTRTRVSIAELAANGGAPMGFYTRFKDPAARAEIVRYYQFLSRYADIYRGNQPYAEVLLTFPRKSIHAGNLNPLETFRKIGQQLLNEHVLFNVAPDDMVTPEFAKRYHVVVDPLKDSQPVELLKPRSRFELPRTARISVSRPASIPGLDLHIVNYDRIEPNVKRSAGTGIADERPVPLESAKVDLLLPTDFLPQSVTFISPEEPESRIIDFKINNGRLQCTIPRLLVYGVIRLQPEM